jgi:hypothetical protein
MVGSVVRCLDRVPNALRWRSDGYDSDGSGRHIPVRRRLTRISSCREPMRLAASRYAPHTRQVQREGSQTMLYELRIYECVPGRLPDLNKRFSTITLKIWERHGIKQAGFWTTVIGESNQTLYYMLQWDSLADREKKWNAFQADPEWHAARAKTEEAGAIVANVKNFILGPTPYSSVQ